MSICDGIKKIPLPRYLKEYSEEILHIKFDKDDSLGQDYNPKKWQREFTGDPSVTDDLKRIRQKCPVKISRSDVAHFAQETQSGGYPELKRLFLACMIWGYGQHDTGLTNTSKTLSDPRLRAVLEKSLERIKKTQIREAYQAFNLKGCGPAFFTKFFYFVGKEYNVKPLPLILDSHVANFLEFLSKQTTWELSLFAKRSQKGFVKRHTEGYIQYICSMDNWSMKLGCAADTIEYFMYKRDQALVQEEKEEGIPEDSILWCHDGLRCSYCEELLSSPPFDKKNIKALITAHVCKINNRQID
ncbi:MAG: hypothetical protein ABR958_01660 [Dehalococcoidales bacterium]